MFNEYCGHHEIESIHSNLVTDVSEEDQESLSGGFVMIYFHQTEIFSDAANTTNYSGSVTPGGSGGPTVAGNFNGSSNSSYHGKDTTFIYTDSSASFVGLPRLLGWLSSMM
jgi:hypothetical protein